MCATTEILGYKFSLLHRSLSWRIRLKMRTDADEKMTESAHLRRGGWVPSCNVPLTVSQQSDNTAAAAVVKKMSICRAHYARS